MIACFTKDMNSPKEGNVIIMQSKNPLNIQQFFLVECDKFFARVDDERFVMANAVRQKMKCLLFPPKKIYQ